MIYMKYLLAFVVLMVAVFTVSAAEKETRVFTLDHQMSQHCEKKIMENLRFEKGVSDIKVSLPDNTITIVYNPAKTDPAKLIKAFKKIGFNAFEVDGELGAEEEETVVVGGSCCGACH